MSLKHAEELAESGNFEAAIAAFQAALQQDSSNAAAWDMLAQCMMEMGAYEEACTAANNAVQLEPKWADAHLTYARACRNAGYLRHAIPAFESCMGLDETTRDSVADELREAEEVWQRMIAKYIGLPSLRIIEGRGASSGPGCIVWPAGMMLAKLLVQENGKSLPDLRNRTILELGSGTGVVGITAALLGAHVLVTDRPALLQLLSQNVSSHSEAIRVAGGTATISSLEWEDMVSCIVEGPKADTHEVLDAIKDDVDRDGDLRLGIDHTGGQSHSQYYSRGTGCLETQSLGAESLIETEQDQPYLVFSHATSHKSVLDAGSMQDIDLVKGKACCSLRTLAAKLPKKGEQFDLVMCADLIYSKQAVQLVTHMLVRILKEQPSVSVFFAHKHRHEDVDALMLALFGKGGLHLREIAQGEEIVGNRGKCKVTIYQVACLKR